jgi:hypothetical protein
MAVAQGKPSRATAAAERFAGLLKYEITDGKTGKVLKKGSLKVKAKDIAQDKTSAAGLTIVEQRIALGGHFNLSLMNGSSASHGFAFTGGRDNQKTFSWDWFDVDGDRAQKLQEGGELALTWRPGGGISRTEFLSDVSLRINPLSDAAGATPRWRIKILKGSAVSWP